jgi:L-asparaginase
MGIIITNYLGEKGMQIASKALNNNEAALDVIEKAMSICEEDETVDIVGRGRWPNALGVMETDSGVMNGNTLEVGSVGAVIGIVNTFSLARKVMETLPHVMLVGEGATRFAKELGFKIEELLSEQGSSDYKEWLKENDINSEKLYNVITSNVAPDNNFHKDTVVYMVQDNNGDIVAGSSTSGWPFKYPGRLGDGPICGAGFYADNKYGACVCTNTGEMTIRNSTARSVILYMKKGASLLDACNEAVVDLRELKTGYIGSISHAINTKGEHYVLMTEDTEKDFCLYKTGFENYTREKVNLV